MAAIVVINYGVNLLAEFGDDFVYDFIEILERFETKEGGNTGIMVIVVIILYVTVSSVYI